VSYTFRVIFDGVCAYVPDKPFFKEDKKTCRWYRRSDEVDQKDPRSGPARSLAVLLPDLRRPGLPRVPDNPQLNFPTFRDPHFPLLKFRLGDLRESTTRRVDLVCRDISRLDEEGILFLRREQIRFNMDAENANAFSFADWVPKYQDQAIPRLECREEIESLWWMPDLVRIVPEGAEKTKAVRAKANVLPSYRGPFPEGLIARIECLGGRLRTYDFNRNVDGVPLPWRFAPPDDRSCPGYWNRALSNSVALEFFDVRDDVHIELKRLANEVVVEELVLAPAPGASRPVVEIHISNREPDLLFEEEGFSRSALPDMDFQPFYELLSDFNPELVHELPIPHPARTTFFGIREKPCAGTLMEG
jgi:hypothetical protein